MRLRLVYAIYLSSTTATIIAPVVVHHVELARRTRIPVNTEAPLQPPPPLNELGVFRKDSMPACTGSNGMAYFENGTFAARGAAARQVFPEQMDDRFRYGGVRSCAFGADGGGFVVWKGDRERRLSAYAGDGTPRWSVAIEENESRIALARDGTVYIVTAGRGDTATLWAYGGDGSRRWSVPVGAKTWAPIAPVIAADENILVYVSARGVSANELVSLTPDGRERWRARVPKTSGGLVANGDAELISSNDGKIFAQITGGVIAFDTTGKQLWQFTSDMHDIDGGLSVASDGTLYLAERFLYALSSNGAVKWTFKSERTYTDRDYFVGTPLIADDGTIYARTSYDVLYAITPDGRKQWVAQGDPPGGRKRWASIALTSDGRLLTESGWFPVPAGLAKGGWPKRGRDESNSRRQEPQP